MCNEHINEQACRWCVCCQVLICLDCFQTHSKHKLKRLKDTEHGFINDAKNKLQKAIQSFKSAERKVFHYQIDAVFQRVRTSIHNLTP